MQRDLELVRRILFRLEGTEPESDDWSGRSGDREEDLASLHYHVQLMNDAGLIRADELVPGQWFPERMTWEGHEFLDVARNDDIWNEAKRRIERKLGTAPLELVRELLLEIARERLAKKKTKKRKR